MKKSKKVISLLLSAVMLLSVINTGFVAFATGTTGYAISADEAEMLPDAGAVTTSTQVVRVASGRDSYLLGSTIVAATPSGIPAMSNGNAAKEYANVGDINETASFPTVSITFKDAVENVTISCSNSNSLVCNVVMSQPVNNGNTYTWTVQTGTANAGDTLIYKIAYTYNGKQYVSKAYSYVENIAMPAGSEVTTKTTYDRFLAKDVSAGVSAVTRVLGINTYGNLESFNETTSETRGYYNPNTNIFVPSTNYPTYSVISSKEVNNSDTVKFELNNRRSYADVYVDSSATDSLEDLNLRYAVTMVKNNGDNSTQILQKINAQKGNVTATVGQTTGSANYDLGMTSVPASGMTAGQQIVTEFKGSVNTGLDFTTDQEYTIVTEISATEGNANNSTAFPVGIRIHSVNKGELRALINDILHNYKPESPLTTAQYKGVNPQSWYYSSGFSEYETAMTKAQTVLQNPRAEQSEINNEIASLTAAYNGLVLKEADYSAVTVAQNRAAAYEASKHLYTDESYAELMKAVSVYDAETNPDGTIQPGCSVLFQPQVDLWAEGIYDAIKGLEYRPADYTTLDELYAEALEAEAHKDDYTNFADLKDVMNSIDWDVKITEQSKVTQMEADLRAALANLKYTIADYTELNKAIARAQTYSAANYTPESYAELTNILTSIPLTLDRSQQDIVDGYITQIDEAIENLEELPAVYVELETLINTFDSFNAEHYIPETYQPVKELVEEYRAAYKDIGITRQDEIDDMCDALEEAMGTLELYDADYSEIERLILEYNNSKNPDQMTAASIKRVEDAIAMVEYGLKADRQDEVDNYAQIIDNAIRGLEYTPADYSAVDRAEERAADVVRSKWSADSLARLDAALRAVVRGYGVNRQEEVDLMAANINAAINELQPGPADYTEVRAAIADFNALDHSHYTSVSVANVQNIINEINWDLTTDDQATVSSYSSRIYAAMFKLEEALADYSELRRIRDSVPLDLAERYTETTVSEYNLVLNSIDWNLKAKDQAKVLGYQRALQAAIDNLKLKPGDYTDVDKAIAEGRAIIEKGGIAKKDIEAFETFVAEINRDYTLEEQGEIAKLAAQIRAMYEKFSAAESNYTATIKLKADKKLTYTGDTITVSVIVGTDYYAAATSIPVLYDSNFFELIGSSVQDAFHFEGSFAESSQTGGNIKSPSKGYPASYTESEKAQWKYALITIAPDPEINDDAQILDPEQTVVKLQFRVKELVGLNGKIWIDEAFLKTDENKTGRLFLGRYRTPEVDNNVASVGQTIDLTEATISINVVDANAPADFTELMSAYNTVLNPSNKEYYDSDSYEAYEDALRGAEAIIADMGSYTVKEQNIVDAAADALNNAIAGLKLLPANTAPLESALTLVPEHASDKYTAETYSKYQSAVDAGNAILAEEGLTVVDNERISKAAEAIQTAFEGLALKPFSHKTMMENALSAKPDYEASYYTEASYKEYEDAYNALIAFKAKNPTILDDAEGLPLITTVNIKRNNLVLKPADTSLLEEAIAEFNNKNEAHYTETSYSRYKKAVDEGKAILAESGLTVVDNERIVAAANAINSAERRLEIKPFSMQDAVDEALWEWGYEPWDYEDDYTVESFEEYMNAYYALDDFDYLIEDKNATHDDEAVRLIEELRTAIANLKYHPADLTLLEEALGLETPVEEYYTEETYQDYKDALAALEAYGEDYYWGRNEQDIVNGLAQDIIDAHGALEYKPFSMLDELEAAITVTPEYAENYYIPEVYAEYKAALKVINDTIANADNLTIMDDAAAVEAIADYNAALEALKSAWADADYSDVEEAIREADALNRDIYTNFEIVDEAKAQVVYGLNIFDQETVNGYAAAIREAIKNLEFSGADYTAVEDAKTAAAEKLSIMQATGIELKQSTVDALNAAINDVVYGLKITEQETVQGYADAIIAATEVLDYVSTIVLKDGAEAYLTEEGYVKGLANVSEADIIAQFDVYGKNTRLVVTPTVNGYGTGTLVQHYDGEELVKEYVIVVDGDADGDGYVNAFDETIAAYYINEFIEPETEYIMEALDLEKDGWLDAIDFTIIVTMVNMG